MFGVEPPLLSPSCAIAGRHPLTTLGVNVADPVLGVHTSRPSVLTFPRLVARRNDPNGDMRDCSDAGSSEMTVDMLLSVVVRSQTTSSYVGMNGLPDMVRG